MTENGGLSSEPLDPDFDKCVHSESSHGIISFPNCCGFSVCPSSLPGSVDPEEAMREQAHQMKREEHKAILAQLLEVTLLVFVPEVSFQKLNFRCLIRLRTRTWLCLRKSGLRKRSARRHSTGSHTSKSSSLPPQIFLRDSRQTGFSLHHRGLMSPSKNRSALSCKSYVCRTARS